MKTAEEYASQLGDLIGHADGGWCAECDNLSDMTPLVTPLFAEAISESALDTFADVVRLQCPDKCGQGVRVFRDSNPRDDQLVAWGHHVYALANLAMCMAWAEWEESHKLAFTEALAGRVIQRIGKRFMER